MVNYERARRTMVDNQLRTFGVIDHVVLGAMLAVPREMFVPANRKALAYIDDTHPLGGTAGRVLPAPGPFGLLVQLADVKPTDIVLDVACGTGYSTAVLAGLANAVVAIDEDPDLVETANTVLAELDIGNAAALTANLAEGVPSEAPFDLIFVGGAVDYVSDALFAQLRDGGRLVTAMTSRGKPVARVYVKTGKDIGYRDEFDVSVPQIASLTRPAEFVL